MAENKLTDKALRALKPTDREQVIGDGGGLWVRVMPIDKGGAINFYYRFQHQGKEHRFNCGSYPETTLAVARKLRNAARDDVKAGINPLDKLVLERDAAAAAIAIKKAEKTVHELFEDWERVFPASKGRPCSSSIKPVKGCGLQRAGWPSYLQAWRRNSLQPPALQALHLGAMVTFSGRVLGPNCGQSRATLSNIVC